MCYSSVQHSLMPKIATAQFLGDDMQHMQPPVLANEIKGALATHKKTKFDAIDTTLEARPQSTQKLHLLN